MSGLRRSTALSVRAEARASLAHPSRPRTPRGPRHLLHPPTQTHTHTQSADASAATVYRPASRMGPVEGVRRPTSALTSLIPLHSRPTAAPTQQGSSHAEMSPPRHAHQWTEMVQWRTSVPQSVSPLLHPDLHMCCVPQLCLSLLLFLSPVGVGVAARVLGRVYG